MLKNKATKLAVLSLLGILGLTACGTSSSDEIYAKPRNYDDPIVQFTGTGDEVHNNVLKIVYDAIHEGTLSSKVLDKSLYNFAESVFGVYNSLTRTAGNTEITLKEAVMSYKGGDNTKINTFIKAHKVYWKYNDDGEHIDDNDKVVNDETFTPCDSERAAVVSKWDAIENRIAENMYSRALSGTYTEKHLFRESKFIKALHEQGEKVNYQAASEASLQPVFVPYTVEKKDIFGDPTAVPAKPAYLNRDYYQSSASVDSDEYATIKARFIEDNVIPEVYNDLLIEQYILDENVQAIRNTRARKVNVIKIEKGSSSFNADYLIDALVDEIYADAPAASDTYVRTNADEIEAAGNALFEKYAMIAKGLYDEIQANAEAKALVESLHSQLSVVYNPATYKDSNNTEWHYYENTTYADLIKEYQKLDEAETFDDLDDSLYSSYTSSGTTSVQEGLEQKILDIKQQESITKGWFIQNKTATFDSAGVINERLYKLSVANAKLEIGEDGTNQQIVQTNKDLLAERDRYVKKAGTWQLRDEWEDESSFVCSINGTYYLKFDGQYYGENRKKDIVYDDGNAYYIVQVLEASKDSKLRNVSDSPLGSYVATRGKAFYNEAIDEISKILGETGNYASASKDHWLKKMDFKYHDQKVYDYFKENYPDLFK